MSREDNHQKGSRVQLIPTNSPEYEAALQAEERKVRQERADAKAARAERESQQDTTGIQQMIEQL